MSDSLLTPRQAEVLSLISEGLCNKEISKKLGVSDSATDCHITNVLEKLKVNNRTKAAAIYLNAKLTQANKRIEELEINLSCAKGELAGNTCIMCNYLERADCYNQKAEQQTKIDRLCEAVINAYECGHNDTVESNYCDPKERAAEIIEEIKDNK